MRSITLLFFLCFGTSLYAQANDTESALYNVGFGAVFSTIGAIINKTANEPLDKVIQKSLWQGALGGYVTFESKRLLREARVQNQWRYFWAAKLVNAAGTSIKENAALNKDFWEKWHINIAFSRIEFELKDKFRVNYKIMPVALAFSTEAFFRYKFELDNSFRVGELVFSNENLNGLDDSRVNAASLPGYLVFNPQYLTDYNFNVHEVLHQYQSNGFSIFNTYLNKPIKSLSSKNKTINWFNTHLYVEYHYIILRPVYLLESAINGYHYNLFEHEAGYYGNTF